MGNRLGRGKPPAVLAIHSTDQWNAHFESSKRSPKLVIFLFLRTYNNVVCCFTSRLFNLWRWWWTSRLHGADPVNTWNQSSKISRLSLGMSSLSRLMWMSWRYLNSLCSNIIGMYQMLNLLLLMQDVASEFGVDAMPTFVFFHKGKQVDRLVGANKAELKLKISQHKL